MCLSSYITIFQWDGKFAFTQTVALDGITSLTDPLVSAHAVLGFGSARGICRRLLVIVGRFPRWQVYARQHMA